MSTTTAPPIITRPPRLGQSIAVGCLVGVVVSLAGVSGAMLAAGNDWVSALGLGLFAAFWGGLGFGTMIGGVVYATRLEAAEAAEAARTAESAEPLRSTPAETREAA